MRSSDTQRLLIGNRALCQKFLKQQRSWYIYILRRPDGRPFYVGKGKGDRVFHHENEARHPNGRMSNSHKLNVIRSILRSGDVITYEIDSVFEHESSAYARETDLITTLKRLHEGGPLTNRAPGGGSSQGAAPASKERHSATLAGNPSDNPERAVLNTYVLSVGRMDSVVIKPISQFSAKPTQRFPRSTRVPSFRQAVALVAAASANGVSMDSACVIPRKVIVDDVIGLVENGVACDLLTSGMASVVAAANPNDECFSLDVVQARQAIGFVGLRKCIDLGVLRADAFEASSTPSP